MAIIINFICETVFLEFLDIYASFVLLHGEAAAVGFQKRDAKNALGGNGSVSEILFVSKRCVALVHNSKQHPFLGSSTTELYTRFLTSISIIARADLSQLKMPLQLHKIESNSDKIQSCKRKHAFNFRKITSWTAGFLVLTEQESNSKTGDSLRILLVVMGILRTGKNLNESPFFEFNSSSVRTKNPAVQGVIFRQLKDRVARGRLDSLGGHPIFRPS